MIEDISYPDTAMLPGIHYEFSGSSFSGSTLVDLEYETAEHLTHLSDSLKFILIAEGILQIPEVFVAHLCAYIGYVSVYSLGFEHAQKLEEDMVSIVRSQAQASFELFKAYPLNGDIREKSIENIEICKQKSPGSIVPQTMRLGRAIYDMLDEINNAKHKKSGPSRQDEEDLFAPIVPLLSSFKEHSISLLAHDRDVKFDINQLCIQVGYLIGYYAHLDGSIKPYKEFGLPCLPLFIEYGNKFIEEDKESKVVNF